MPDITMCNGERGEDTCPIRDKCYRFTASPDPLWQSYFQVAPFIGGNPRKPYKFCESFWGYDNFGRSTCKR